MSHPHLPAPIPEWLPEQEAKQMTMHRYTMEGPLPHLPPPIPEWPPQQEATQMNMHIYNNCTYTYIGDTHTHTHTLVFFTYTSLGRQWAAAMWIGWLEFHDTIISSHGSTNS